MSQTEESEPYREPAQTFHLSECSRDLGHLRRGEDGSAEMLHLDETGMRVNQYLWWLPVAATQGLTETTLCLQRG